VAYSSVQRLFTEQQRLAMAARDGGCSYWGCDHPAAWTQAHHVQEWHDTHRTTVDQGALICGANHRTFQTMGWTNQIINADPTGSHPAGSTHNKHHEETPSTTEPTARGRAVVVTAAVSG
jgi:hypothetical protein